MLTAAAQTITSTSDVPNVLLTLFSGGLVVGGAGLWKLAGAIGRLEEATLDIGRRTKRLEDYVYPAPGSHPRHAPTPPTPPF